MKKLLFVLAFAFIGGQAFSQMYMVTLTYCGDIHPSNCNPSGSYYIYYVLTKVDPAGTVTYTCIDQSAPTNNISSTPTNVVILNQELNNIISQGYKLVYTSSTGTNELGAGIDGFRFNPTIWYFAIP